MSGVLDRAAASPARLREAIRAGRAQGSTGGACPGYLQCNLVVVPAAFASELEAFCRANPGPCPLIEALPSGDPRPRAVAGDADLRTDLGLYRVFRHGQPTDEVADIHALWREDSVAFLLGCSFSLDDALARAGIPLRHVEQGRHIPAYVSSRMCTPVGRFRGPEVLSARPIPRAQVAAARAVAARYPDAHGAPVHVGDPRDVGIASLAAPDFGDPPVLEPGDVPVFWPCGITPQVLEGIADIPLMITHARGRMFVTDLRLSRSARRTGHGEEEWSQ